MRPDSSGSMHVQLTITEHGTSTRLDLVMPLEIPGLVSVQVTI